MASFAVIRPGGRRRRAARPAGCSRQPATGDNGRRDDARPHGDVLPLRTRAVFTSALPVILWPPASWSARLPKTAWFSPSV